MAVTFEGYERRIDQIMPVLNKYGIKDEEILLIINEDKENTLDETFFEFFLHISNFISNFALAFRKSALRR